MLKLLIATIAALTPAAPAATAQSAPMPAGVYHMDRGRSSLHWRVSHLGLSHYTARFSRFEATLDIDPAMPETAKLAVTVDPTSLRTDFPFADRFDRELIEDAHFFNSGTFPKITFHSTKIERTGERTAKVTGDLTLLGVTRQLTMDVTLATKAEPENSKRALGFSATGKLKRSDFGIITRTFIADEVLLLIEAEFIKS